MYSVKELHLFLCSFSLAIFTSSILFVHSSTSLSTTFCYTYNLNNLNSHQYHKIYHIHTHNYLVSKSILYYIRLYQSILYTHTYIYLHSNVTCCYKHLHLLYIYIYITDFMPFYMSRFICP